MKVWRGWQEPGSGPSNCPGTSPSSWTATAAGRKTGGGPGSSATAGASRASGRSSRKAAGSVSIRSRSIAFPSRELMFLLKLLKHFLVVERAELMDQNVKLSMIGRREELPPEVLREFDRTVVQTEGNTGMTLCLAVNYGGRTEIADAARKIAADVRAGRLDPDHVDEAVFASYLATAGMPDPDLLIRTAGELRVSNFLLWQISYAELFVTDVLWPDFRGDDLLAACRAYAARQRKFGGLPARAMSAGPS
jgi:undecaprenyl diphosphate synthase